MSTRIGMRIDIVVCGDGKMMVDINVHVRQKES